MGLFSRKKDTEAASILRKIDGKRIEYVTERDMETYTESVIGRDGAINILENKIVIMCEAHTVFTAPLAGLKYGELMSLDGITFCGFDTEEQKERSIVAYYKYYR